MIEDAINHMEFYSTQRNQLQQFLENNTQVRHVVIFGNIGLGKSKIIEEMTSQRDFVSISFDKEFRPPFNYISQDSSLSHEKRREQIIMELSKMYIDKECIIYKNFECCDMDSLELIKQVIQFHEANKLPAVSIIEWNSDCKPDYPEWDNTTYISFQELPDNDLAIYIKSIIKTKKQEQFTYVCDHLTHIAHGNLLALQLGINILLQKGILVKLPNGKYDYKGDEFSDCLFILYLELFKTLENHIQEALRMIVPFDDCVYISLFKNAFTQCQMIDKYLDEISKYQSFILRKQVLHNNKSTAYSFTAEEAKQAVTESTPFDYLSQITAQLYEYLETLYKKSVSLPDISKEDQIYLLVLLTKVKNQNLTINHLSYFVKLMQYYYDYASYREVICQAEKFLNKNVLSLVQINSDQPLFFRLYFRSLLAIGQYDTIIQYFDKLSDWDIKLLIAYAYYNKGNPAQALELCKKLETEHLCGEIYSLEASIYDWMGDNKNSAANFKKALLYIANNDALKYTLYKKYSLYVDFELPECRNRIEAALNYYRTTSVRQYAETLHNYGTDNVMIFSDTSLSFLQEAEQLFLSLCEKEVYYPQNSIAIYYCLQENYSEAIKIWERIDVQNIPIDFCRLAIQNNLFCAYIKNYNLESAVNIKIQLENHLRSLNLLENPKQIAQQRPDIQHQVRQFFLNCALLALAQDRRDMAFEFFMSALECSKYHSTMLYLIQNQVEQLQKTEHASILDKLYSKIRSKKLGCPGKLAKFFAQHQMYYCILMFWGDYE